MKFPPPIPRWGYSLWKTCLVLALVLTPIILFEVWTLRWR